SKFGNDRTRRTADDEVKAASRNEGALVRMNVRTSGARNRSGASTANASLMRRSLAEALEPRQVALERFLESVSGILSWKLERRKKFSAAAKEDRIGQFQGPNSQIASLQSDKFRRIDRR